MSLTKFTEWKWWAIDNAHVSARIWALSFAHLWAIYYAQILALTWALSIAHNWQLHFGFKRNRNIHHKAYALLRIMSRCLNKMLFMLFKSYFSNSLLVMSYQIVNRLIWSFFLSILVMIRKWEYEQVILIIYVIIQIQMPKTQLH